MGNDKLMLSPVYVHKRMSVACNLGGVPFHVDSLMSEAEAPASTSMHCRSALLILNITINGDAFFPTECMLCRHHLMNHLDPLQSAGEWVLFSVCNCDQSALVCCDTLLRCAPASTSLKRQVLDRCEPPQR